jgi:crotonobetainyl-CoA:carnitine CoA-transferase CaiB-like acyl-CoA transferase
MSGLPDQPPAGWGFSYLDHTAGYYGAIAALMALNYRRKTGKGQYIDISQIETGMVLNGVPMLDYQVNGREYTRTGNHAPGLGVAPHCVYRCKDILQGEDRWIAIAADTEEQWLELCDVLGAADLVTDERFASNAARLANQDALDEAITVFTRRFDTRELMYLLQARGVPAGAAQNTRDKMEFDPQHAYRGFYQSAPHTELGDHRFEGFPVQFSESRWQMKRGAPCLGEDSMDVLTHILGYSEAEVGDLMAEAAI